MNQDDEMSKGIQHDNQSQDLQAGQETQTYENNNQLVQMEKREENCTENQVTGLQLYSQNRDRDRKGRFQKEKQMMEDNQIVKTFDIEYVKTEKPPSIPFDITSLSEKEYNQCPLEADYKQNITKTILMSQLPYSNGANLENQIGSQVNGEEGESPNHQVNGELLFSQLTFGGKREAGIQQQQCAILMPKTQEKQEQNEASETLISPQKIKGSEEEFLIPDSQKQSQAFKESSAQDGSYSGPFENSNEIVPSTILCSGQNTSHLVKNNGKNLSQPFQREALTKTHTDKQKEDSSTILESQDQKIYDTQQGITEFSVAESDSQKQMIIRRTSNRNRVKSQKADVQEDSGNTRPRRNLQKEQEAPNKESPVRFKGNQDPKKDQEDGEQIQENTKDPKILDKLTSSAPADNIMKVKKSGANMFEETVKKYQKMFFFDWDLKDIINQKHSPRDDLTTGAFWFYFNTTFFPHNLQQTVCDQSFEEWVTPIMKKLNTFSVPILNNSIISTDKLKQNKISYQNNLMTDLNFSDSELEDQIELNQTETPNKLKSKINLENIEIDLDLLKEHTDSHVSKLIGKRKKFNRFKQHFGYLHDRAQKCQFDDNMIQTIESEANKIPRLSIQQNEIQEQYNAADEITQIKETIQCKDFQKMLQIAEMDLQNIQQRNYCDLESLFTQIQSKYRTALTISKDSEDYKDMKLYKPEEVYKYGKQFMSYVDPGFVQDMAKNKDWYNENMNQYLLNINYATKLQTDFLKELELSQQRRNDQQYRKILDKMEKMDIMLEKIQKDGDSKEVQLKRKELENGIQKLSIQQRAQIAEEDACCAICGVGDYEDHDKIVFCVRCSIPVHQSCFGLEFVPEIDWICNNCMTFSFNRGLMVKCFLCPKKGGAMKPTNIFSSYEKFYYQKIKRITPKTGRNTIDKLNNEALTMENESQDQELDKEQYQIYKQQTTKRHENNASLSELLQREYAYKDKILDEYEQQVIENEKLEKEGKPVPELNEQHKALKIQEDFPFHFNKHEKENHCIPEDYNHFIQRNESALEQSDAPVSDTLYHWVHHSCSMWMPGPYVTPRTPVRMNKLDFQRFSFGCIICGKKGCHVGACVKCCRSECTIYFHVECAKRSNYCMEIEKKNHLSNKEKVFKIFCEKHRPFKIIQEIEDQNAKEVEDIQKFTKTIEKAIETQYKHSLKPKKLISKAERNKLLRQALQNKKQELIQIKKESKLNQKPKRERKEKQAKKKWRERDKKTLYDNVKEKYQQIMKLRMNLIKVDPMIAETKRYQKELKRIQKQEEKKRKQEFQIKQKQILQALLKDRDQKSQERGLRNRIKNEEGIEVSASMSQRNDSMNPHDREAGQSFHEHKENENRSNPNKDEMEDMKMEEDQENSNNLKTNEQLNVNIIENELIESNSHQLGNYENYGAEAVMSHQTNNKITLNLEGDAEMETEMAPETQIQNESNVVTNEHLADEVEEDANSQQQQSQLPEIPVLRELPDYYKLATPINIQELEWTVCNSLNDFPWHKISFEPYSAKQCYKMYSSQVKDPKSFLQKVLGDKQKFQKMMNNQLNGLPTFDAILNMTDPNVKQVQGDPYGLGISKLASSSHADGVVTQKSLLPGALFGIENMGPGGGHQQAKDAGIIQLNNGGILNTLLYCKCKGQFQSDFMVGCENDEEKCPNGGWLHPECTEDLKNLTRVDIEQQVGTYFCEDCRTGETGIGYSKEHLDAIENAAPIEEENSHNDELPEMKNIQINMEEHTNNENQDTLNQSQKIPLKLDELLENTQQQHQHTTSTKVIPSQQSSQGNRIPKLKQDYLQHIKNESQRDKQKLIVSIEQEEKGDDQLQSQVEQTQDDHQQKIEIQELTRPTPPQKRNNFINQIQGSQFQAINNLQGNQLSQQMPWENQSLQSAHQKQSNKISEIPKQQQQFQKQSQYQQPLMPIPQQMTKLPIQQHGAFSSVQPQSQGHSLMMQQNGIWQQQLAQLQASQAQQVSQQSQQDPQSQGNQQLQELLNGINSFLQQHAHRQVLQQQQHLQGRINNALPQTQQHSNNSQAVQNISHHSASPANISQQQQPIYSQNQTASSVISRERQDGQDRQQQQVQIEHQIQQQLSELFGGPRVANRTHQSSQPQQPMQQHQHNARSAQNSQNQSQNVSRNQQQANPDDNMMDGELTADQIRMFISNFAQQNNRKE